MPTRHRFDLAYRHGNGEVEGFSAGSFTSAADAQERAIARVRAKAAHTPHPFDAARLIFSPRGLTADELATVRADWKLEERA